VASAAAAAPPPPLCETASPAADGPRLLVLSAFPAELSRLAEATNVETTITLGDRRWHVGRLGGVRVVLGLMGIGLVNAETSARSVLDAFDVAGVVVNGVAGSPFRIGDVVVPTRWSGPDDRHPYRANRALLALAARAGTSLTGALERCALVPPTGPDPVTICMPYEPTVLVGGRGVSDDPFGGTAFPCTPGGGEVFGCELPGDTGAVAAAMRAGPPPVVEDMETAAVARVARERRVPFLGVRAVSDGAGDPLGDRGFPAQFFDYYRLAADNASLVTRAIVGDLGRIATDPATGRACRLLARRRWRRAARLLARRP
jgi:nucleoside phosphorylase